MKPEPTLADLLHDVWAAKFHMVFYAGIFTLAAFCIILFSTPLYKASMIIAPADGYALGDYASSVTEGKSLEIPFWRPREADGVSTDFHRFVFTVKGTSVAAILLKDSAVLSGIAKDGSWSSKADKWTAEELADYLYRKIKVEHLGTTPLRRLSYNHPDPLFASAFLRKIHLVSDQLIRRERRRQSDARIKYLQATLQKTVNPDHRRGITDLLMQQEHIQMLANLDEPYAAIVVEPPSSMPKPVWPNKTMILAVFLIFGAGVGFATWTIRHVR